MNDHPARRELFPVVIVGSLFFLLVVFGNLTALAQSRSLEDAVEKLARKVIAIRHEKRMAMVWINHTGISEARSQELRGMFMAQLDAAEIRLAQGETLPALRVWLEQTPDRIVITASIPNQGETTVVIEEVERSLTGRDEPTTTPVRLEKQLVWQQEKRILAALLTKQPLEAGSGSSLKRLIVLTEDALQIYDSEASGWKLARTKLLPGPPPPPRGARGRLQLTEEHDPKVVILLPGKRCEANTADDAAATCVAANTEFPAGRLLIANECGAQTWWLKSADTDWTEEDHLLLRSSGGGRESAPVAETSVAGPVHSISAGETSASSAIVVRNLANGKYEVYRVSVSCDD